MMEKELVAHHVGQPERTEEDNRDGGPDTADKGPILMKFASVAELEKSYEQLHKEFTRKSMRLAELEKQYAECSEVVCTGDVADGGNAGAAGKIQTQTESAENTARCENDAADKQISTQQFQHERVSKDAQKQPSKNINECTVQSREEIIREYLLSVASRAKAPAVITTNNDFPAAGGGAPKSIREVGKIAKIFFERREK